MRESYDSFDYLFKIVLIGDPGVGKTCLVQRFCTGTYVERQGSTIGVDFTMKTVQIDQKRIKLQIWDTAGQERFRTIAQSYYRNANGVIITYDITKKQTFSNVTRWIEDIKRYAPKNIIQIIVGNKKDLNEEREVKYEEARTLGEYCDIKEVLEASAKLQIWDTAGQERFRTITQSYYRNANGVIITYDITKKQTFSNVTRWIEDIKRYAPKNIIQIMVGNKKDLNEEREVKYDEARTLGDYCDIKEVLEASAKDATNVDEAFYSLASALKKRYEIGSQIQNIDDGKVLFESKEVNQKWKCCS